jgi:hypothetical protein
MRSLASSARIKSRFFLSTSSEIDTDPISIASAKYGELAAAPKTRKAAMWLPLLAERQS